MAKIARTKNNKFHKILRLKREKVKKGLLGLFPSRKREMSLKGVEASNVINDPKCNKGPKCNNFWP